jgi:hypothetical protein
MKSRDVAPLYGIPDEVRANPVWLRLVEQLEWYDRKSRVHQRTYKAFTFSKLALAGLIPILVLISKSSSTFDATLIVSVIGLLIALIEGATQINQNANLWVQYRQTAEQLRHEQFLFLARSGAYRGLAMEDAVVLLAERSEERVATEHAAWVRAVSAAVLRAPSKSET